MITRTIAALALAAAAPALGQPAANGAPAPTPEAIAAALELLPQDLLEQQLLASSARLIDAMLEEHVEAARRRGDDIPSELHERLRVVVQEENLAVVESILPTFRNEAAMIYARYFSADDLRELRRLQQHPVMQRMERLMPELMAELSRIGLRAGAERQPEVERRIAELIEQWHAEQEAQRAPPRT